MQIRNIFETKVEEKIDPVIKVGERQNEQKLAAEIGSYVVTPTIEKYLDDFFEHYSETYRVQTTEIGVWISGYFGSGKSHLAKIVALLAENRILDGIPASKRFECRVPADAPHRSSIIRSLTLLSQCNTRILAFNLNTLADSKSTPLPRLLLSQFYMSKGYGANFLYARVIEAELDKIGKLDALHSAVERLTNKPWKEIQENLNFYARPLYQAACEVAPSIFATPEDVAQALKNAEKGELFNVQFLIKTMIDDLKESEKQGGKPCRLVLVLDESGQWIEDDAGRLAQLQALVEEAAIVGQGRIWTVVTTHEDIGSLYQNARALKGDMKKIEGRFRFKWSLTTENIELVLQDRIFRKNLSGKNEVTRLYNENPGILRDLGQLANTSQKMPECNEEKFVIFYPFFPYQIHLIPDIVKSLRSAGGRGEQLSGSTRTLLAITQDILRDGRRKYLDAAVGEIISFDEIYNNLAGEAEVSADARRELGQIEKVVPEATVLTRRIAEVLYIIREIVYIPRTIDNIARLLVEHTSDNLMNIRAKIEPELKKLIAAKLVAKLGEEYEFLTGERRTFEEEVADESASLKWQDLESSLLRLLDVATIGFQSVPFKNAEFPVRISVDGSMISREGAIEIRVVSTLGALAGAKVSDLEDMSLRPDEQQTIFILSDRIPNFDDQLRYHSAMRAVIDRWKGDPHKSEEAHRLASERESKDLDKLRRKVLDGINQGLKNSYIIFRGASRVVSPKPGQATDEVIRIELALFWPTLYPKYEKVPIRINNEQRAILDILRGVKELSPDIKDLKLFDKAGQLDPHCPILDAVRVYLSTRQSRKERTIGKDIVAEFSGPPYGWDPAAIRVGLAGLLRSGALRLIINKKPFTNPADPELQDALRVSRQFEKVELVLEEAVPDPDKLTTIRSLIMKITGKRKIDETPAALSAEIESFANELVSLASRANLWAEPAGLPLPIDFVEGKEGFEKLLSLVNPVHRVDEIHARKDSIETLISAIRTVASFIDKWGKAFSEMRKFAGALASVEYRLLAGGSCESFLKNWRVAIESKCVCAETTWKDLQNAKAMAELEMIKQLSIWRETARTRASDALSSLSRELIKNDLPPVKLQEILSIPLKSFLESLDQEIEIVRVATMPDLANKLIGDLGESVRLEREKRGREKGEPKPKPIKRVILNEINKATYIESALQWDAIRDDLNEIITKELKEGNRVELK